MDAQKISEAASTIKKADHATRWLNGSYSLGSLRIETVGGATSHPGHGEATKYLAEAFDDHRASIHDLAKRLALEDKKHAEETIRQEVQGG